MGECHSPCDLVCPPTRWPATAWGQAQASGPPGCALCQPQPGRGSWKLRMGVVPTCLLRAGILGGSRSSWGGGEWGVGGPASPCPLVCLGPQQPLPVAPGWLAFLTRGPPPVKRVPAVPTHSTCTRRGPACVPGAPQVRAGLGCFRAVARTRASQGPLHNTSALSPSSEVEGQVRCRPSWPRGREAGGSVPASRSLAILGVGDLGEPSLAAGLWRLLPVASCLCACLPPEFSF